MNKADFQLEQGERQMAIAGGVAPSSCTGELHCSAADEWEAAARELVVLADRAERAGRRTDSQMLRYVMNGWYQHAAYLRRQNDNAHSSRVSAAKEG